MSTIEISEHQWTKLLEFLRSCPDLYVGREQDCRRYLEAILWMARSGAPWRLLPEEYGHWNTVYKRSEPIKLQHEHLWALNRMAPSIAIAPAQQ